MFTKPWSWALSLALVASLLTACGGGGGGSPDAGGASASKVNSAALSATRHYGDVWALSVSQTLQGVPDLKTFTREMRVEAVRPDGSYSLSLRVPSLDTVATELRDANNDVLASGRCVYPPQGLPKTTFQVGETWTSSVPVSCLNTDSRQTTWTVLSEQNVVKAGYALHVYEIQRETTIVPIDSKAGVQDPSLPNVEKATCLWAPDIGLYVHCSTTSTYSQAPAANAVLREDTDLTAYTPAEASAQPPAATSSSYPAWQPDTWPQVGPRALVSQPTVLTSPRLAPMYFSNTPAPDQKRGFLQRLTASPSWAVLSQYGVGAAIVADDVPVNADAASQVSDADIQSLLSAQISSGHLSVDANTLVVLFYPASTTVTLASGAKSCSSFGAYHANFAGPSGQQVAYAVIPDCRRGIGTLTTATSHEVLEGVVDPYQTGYNRVAGDASWAMALNGAEIGDMCEHDSDLSAREDSTANGTTSIDYMARVWSNVAARAGHNPCVPQRSPQLNNDVYFNSVPQLDDKVQVVRGGAGVARGVVIAPGQSKTIRVHLFSDGPTYGQWNVHATWLKMSTDSDQDPLTFTWDKTSGQNGDVLNLTITAPKAPMPDGAVFKIESRYAGMTTIWTGAVANVAATASASILAGSTTAGSPVDGQGSAAVFGFGGRLTTAPDGSLLVANLGVIRKVQLDGAVTTLTGTGLLANVEALTSDGVGKVYSAGERNQPIGATSIWSRYVQRIDMGSTVSATMLGSEAVDTIFYGQARSSSIAKGPDGRIYVANAAANQIEVMDPATGLFSVYAGHENGSAGADEGVGTAASFNQPMGLSFDAQGVLYVCDTGNHKIRQIARDGTVSTFMGSGQNNHTGGQGAAASLAYPSDIVFDASTGNFYVADIGLIWRIDRAGNMAAVIGGDLGYSFAGLTVDARGTLYATTGSGLAGVVKISFAH